MRMHPRVQDYAHSTLDSLIPDESELTAGSQAEGEVAIESPVDTADGCIIEGVTSGELVLRSRSLPGGWRVLGASAEGVLADGNGAPGRGALGPWMLGLGTSGDGGLGLGLVR